MNLYSRDELSADVRTISTHVMNFQTDVDALKDFGSKTEAMGLKFPYGNVEGIVTVKMYS